MEQAELLVHHHPVVYEPSEKSSWSTITQLYTSLVRKVSATADTGLITPWEYRWRQPAGNTNRFCDSLCNHDLHWSSALVELLNVGIMEG